MSKEAAKTPKQEGAKGSYITKPLEIGDPLISLQKNPFIKEQPELNSAETPGSPEKVRIICGSLDFRECQTLLLCLMRSLKLMMREHDIYFHSKVLD